MREGGFLESRDAKEDELSMSISLQQGCVVSNLPTPLLRLPAIEKDQKVWRGFVLHQTFLPIPIHSLPFPLTHLIWQ